MPGPDDPHLHRLIELATGAYALKLENEVTTHPATDALVAYQEGRLEPSQEADIRRHLVACPQCAEAMERLDAYDQESGLDPALDASAARSATLSWASFRERRARDEGRPVAGLLRPRTTAARSSGKNSAWALAASIALALAGIVSLYLSYYRPNAHWTEARDNGSNPFLFSLLPDTQDRVRSTASVELVEVPKGMDPLVPRLMLGDQTAYPSYSVIIARPSGKVLWKQSSLTRQPSGEFAVLMRRARTPPGDYVLRLFGEEPGSSRELASYTFRLHYS